MVYLVLQAAAQGRFAEMRTQQEELTSAMTPPPARRPSKHAMCFVLLPSNTSAAQAHCSLPAL